MADKEPFLVLPEDLDPSLLRPRFARVLLLTSYCDRPTCSDDFPCPQCLKDCNVFVAEVALENSLGGHFDFLRRVDRGEYPAPEVIKRQQEVLARTGLLPKDEEL